MNKLLRKLRSKNEDSNQDIRELIESIGEDKAHRLVCNLVANIKSSGLDVIVASAFDDITGEAGPLPSIERLVEIARSADYYCDPATKAIDPQAAGSLLKEALSYIKGLIAQGEKPAPTLKEIYLDASQSMLILKDTMERILGSLTDEEKRRLYNSR